MKKRSAYERKMANLAEANRVLKEGGNPIGLKRAVLRYQIEEIEEYPYQMDIRGARLRVPDDPRSREECKSLSEHVLPLEMAKIQTRAPCHKRCLCYWDVVFHDEE